MSGTVGAALLGAVFLSVIQVVAADEASTGVIAAGVVAGVVFLLTFVGVIICCFYKRVGPFADKPHKSKKHKKHKVFVANGYHSPPPEHYTIRHKHHVSNGYAKHALPPPIVQPLPHPVPAFVEPVRYPPVSIPYATYHGPPPEMRHHLEQNVRGGTYSGPPPIVIPFEPVGGTVTIRADPRPVVHKSKYRKRNTSNDVKDDRKRSPSKHRSPSRQMSRPPSQEFVIQQSYDGIPVIRPVIYIDDDEDDRRRHRSKSRDRHQHKKRSPSPKDARITEITDDTKVKQVQPTHDVVIEARTSRPRTPVPVSRASRASSVTEAVNALRRSVEGHIDSDDSSTHSSSKAPSFRWAHNERAPDPVAGDVLFFPAGVEVEAERNKEPHVKQKEEEVYTYTKVIKSSTKERALTPPPSPKRMESPVPVQALQENEGYLVPQDLKRSTIGTRAETKTYETEHDRVTGDFSNIGASMSDRLQNLVEDGDKSRFQHYNIGAVNFGDEETEEERVEMRVRRPDTPPVDIPRDSFYSHVQKRPKTPPNDIPLTSRDSTEVPPLNLRSTINSPREPSPRPNTPPQDFPITPQSSFMKPRPKTPPFDAPETSRPDTSRSGPVDPSTGQPGSFQARQRLIEAHLMKNAQSPSGPPAKSSPPKPTFTPAAEVKPPAPLVKIIPGQIPPPPPPPPPPPVPKFK